MSGTEKDTMIPEELYIKKEDPDPNEKWLDIKEESVEYSAEADADGEYKFSSLALPSPKQETGEESITDNQSKTSACKENNQDGETEEEVEYSASCDTTVGHQHTPTEQELMEDLPESEGKRISSTKTEIRRRRNQNWTADETLLLVHLVKEKKDIIKGRFSPNLTYKDKKEAWKQITKDINDAFPSVVRTVQQVEKRWYNCYQKGKEELSARKRLLSETEAGPPDQIVQVSDPIMDIIEKIMRPNSTSIGVNMNDSEHINNITSNRGKREIMATIGGAPLKMEDEETTKILGNDVNSDTRQSPMPKLEPIPAEGPAPPPIPAALKRPKLDDFRRNKIVILREEGNSLREIAEKVNCDKKTVIRILQKHRETGNTADRPRSRRPRKSTPREDRHLVGLSLSNRRATSTNLAQEWKAQRDVSVDPSTVRRRLLDNGLKARRPAKKPFLLDRNIRARC